MAMEDELSEGLLTEILLMLPVKSLIRFRSVSIYWLSLIQSPNFISLHHHRAAKNNGCLLVKRFCIGGNGDGDLVLSSVLNETPIDNLDLSPMGLKVKDLHLLGSCNGVVLLANFNGPIVICNPAIREFRVLPQPFNKVRRASHLGFGFDPKTFDYKVVRAITLYESDIMPFDPIENPYDSLDELGEAENRGVYEKIEIYELSNDSWREINAVVPKELVVEPHPDRFTSLNGILYWLPYGYYHTEQIISFRLSDESFELIPVPVQEIWLGLASTLCDLNNSLALVLSIGLTFSPPKSCFDIWLMGEYGVKESWTKKYTIGPFLGGRYFPIGCWQNDEFLLVRCGDRRMVSYNANTKKMKVYAVYDRQGSGSHPPQLQVLPYTECLISVKRRIDRDMFR